MKNLIDELTLELSNQVNRDPVDDEFYASAKADAAKAQKKLDELVSEFVSPGLLGLIPLVLHRSKLAQFVASYADRHKKLDWALGEYTDAVESMKCFAIEHAFEQGLKAGLRLQSELKEWAKD